MLPAKKVCSQQSGQNTTIRLFPCASLVNIFRVNLIMKNTSLPGRYFRLTRKERIGIAALLTCICLLLLLPPLLDRALPASPSPLADKSWLLRAEALQTTTDEPDFANQSARPYTPAAGYRDAHPAANAALFAFDPNQLDAAGWKRLGLRDKTIGIILNYRAKGGRFKTAADLQKIYGLHPDEFARLKPFINIETTGLSTPASFSETAPVNKTTKTRYSSIAINSADTTALIALPGIGSKLAARIINFREKLGGFYSVDQVGETFGLPDSVFQKIKGWLVAEPGSIRKININTATVDELKAHPYIRWAIAKAIVAYRDQHGRFERIEDVKKVMVITDEAFKKLFPYLQH